MRNRKRDYEVVNYLRNIFNELEELKIQIHNNSFVINQKIINQANQIVSEIIKQLNILGFDLEDLPLGHDFGHLKRDQRNARLLLKDPVILKKIWWLEILGGYFIGVFHDAGLILSILKNRNLAEKIFGIKPVDRYQEAKNLFRHAEASAVMLEKILDLIDMSFGSLLNPIEEKYLKRSIVHGSSAHTNYNQTFKIGKYTLDPYKKEWSDGSPIQALSLGKWCDRMDTLGAEFIIRHYSTLLDNKSDYTLINGKREFHTIDVIAHMNPYSDGVGTMRTHIYMFLNSQNNPIYVGYDVPNSVMERFRDKRVEEGRILMSMLDAPLPENELINKKKFFDLIKLISMSKNDKKIKKLVSLTLSLPEDYKIRWLSVFTEIYKLKFQ